MSNTAHPYKVVRIILNDGKPQYASLFGSYDGELADGAFNAAVKKYYPDIIILLTSNDVSRIARGAGDAAK